MLGKLPQRDPIGTYGRKVAAARRFADGARCACGEDRPEALIAGSNPSVCAACARKRRGQSTNDLHHPAGKNNSPAKIPVPVNDHRAVLTVAQYDWPRKTLENPEGCPLLGQAAGLRGYLEAQSYLAEKLLQPDPDMLEALSVFLEQKLGPRWWVGTELERFAPRRKPDVKP